MKGAERHEVRKLRLAAVRPVLHVVPVRVARAVAAREPAASVARLERSRKRQRDAAGLAADAERLPVVVFQERHERAVAREAPNRIERESRTVLELAAVRLAIVRLRADIRQHRLIHVNDDLIRCRSASQSSRMGGAESSPRGAAEHPLDVRRTHSHRRSAQAVPAANVSAETFLPDTDSGAGSRIASAAASSACLRSRRLRAANALGSRTPRRPPRRRSNADSAASAARPRSLPRRAAGTNGTYERAARRVMPCRATRR